MNLFFYGRKMGDIWAIDRFITDNTKDYKIQTDYYPFINKSVSNIDCCFWSWLFPKHVKAKNYIHTCHGTGFLPVIASTSPSYRDSQFQKDSILCVYGQFFMKHYIKEGHDPSRIWNVGMPFSYLLEKPADIKDKINFLIKRGLDPDKPVVLYAPTWDRRESSPRGFFCKWFNDGREEERVKKFCDFITKDLQCNLIVRLHEKKRYKRNPVEPYRKYFGKDVYVTFCDEDYNNLPYFIHSDILIGDISGVNTYFYVMDKPVIHIDHREHYKRSFEGYGGMALEDMPNPVVKNFDHLLDSIKEALFYPKKYSDQRKSLVKKYIDYTGEESVKRVLSLIKG